LGCLLGINAPAGVPQKNGNLEKVNRTGRRVDLEPVCIIRSEIVLHHGKKKKGPASRGSWPNESVF